MKCALLFVLAATVFAQAPADHEAVCDFNTLVSNGFLAGDAFVMKCLLYPGGTVGLNDDGTGSGIYENGTAEWPELIVGTLYSKGWYTKDLDSYTTGVYVVSEHYFDWDVANPSGAQMISAEGIEVFETGVGYWRGMTGATGSFSGYTGMLRHTGLSANPTGMMNLLVEFVLVPRLEGVIDPFEVSVNGLSFKISPSGGPDFEYGSTFYVAGYIYPEGTLPSGAGGVNDDGTPEFVPAGTFYERGWWLDGDARYGGAAAITNQIFDWDNTLDNAPGQAMITSEGLNFQGAPSVRSLSSGTGPLCGFLGSMEQSEIGVNVMDLANYRFTSTIMPKKL